MAPRGGRNMTTGFFTADREPSLSLEVRGPNGARSFDAVIDTGFNGGLTLPPDWIEGLGCPQVGEEPLVLADGRQTVTRVCDPRRDRLRRFCRGGTNAPPWHRSSLGLLPVRRISGRRHRRDRPPSAGV